jgi:hypothetical protein
MVAPSLYWALYLASNASFSKKCKASSKKIPTSLCCCVLSISPKCLTGASRISVCAHKPHSGTRFSVAIAPERVDDELPHFLYLLPEPL